METLQRILTGRLPQVIVSTQQFHTLLQMSQGLTMDSVLKRTQQEHTQRPKHPRPNLSTPYVPPRNETERKVAAVWQELLGIEPVGVNDNFFELGGNSLTGLDLIARLKKALSIDTLAAYTLYEAPSVSALAQHIEQSTASNKTEIRHDRGNKRRESLKNRMRETGRMR